MGFFMLPVCKTHRQHFLCKEFWHYNKKHGKILSGMCGRKDRKFLEEKQKIEYNVQKVQAME